MKDINILFISGNWNKEGGRSSRYMTKLINSLENKVGHQIEYYNGGNIDDLEGIISDRSLDADVVFWFPNIPKSYNFKSNPKDYNHRIILVNYKRNDHNKYSFDNLLAISLSLRADMTCEIRKNDSGKYELRIFDILGTLWSDFTTNTGKSISELVSRLMSLKDMSYSRIVSSGNYIEPKNNNLDKIVELYKDFGTKLYEVEKVSSSVKRHLGEISFRGYIDPTNRRNDVIYSSSRNLRFEDVDIKHFVATKYLNGKVNYYGESKPHLDTPVINRLLNHLPEVNYVLYSRCYIKDASYTERCLPTGCLQIVNEVDKVIWRNKYKTNFCVNLLGHGSLIFAKDIDYARSQFVNLEKRVLPEPIGTNFEMIEVDDGIASFISVLGTHPLEEGELIEVRFNDETIGTYKVSTKYYKDDKDRTHKEAYIKLLVKGIPTDLPINGLYARRI